MPLQIRRGTNAERLAMSIPLAQGELLYVTDDQRLYIGNGTALGGVQITGYTNEDAQDAAASLLVSGNHSGISFTYGTQQDGNNRIDATIDLSSYSGSINVDAVKGSVFADDSTLLVDGVSGRIVGPVFANVTGNLTGNVSGNVTGNLTGNVSGNLTGNVTGNTTGYHTGDVKGSVVADDSTMLVDGVAGRIVGPVFANVTGNVTGNLSGNVTGNVTGNLLGNVTGDLLGDVTGDVLGDVTGDLTGRVYSDYIDSGATALKVYSNRLNIFNADADIDFSSVAQIAFKSSNGTVSSPTVVALGETLGTVQGTGWDGSNYTTISGIGFSTSANTLGSAAVPGRIGFFLKDDDGNFNISLLDSTGLLSVTAVQSTGVTTANLGKFLSKLGGAGNETALAGTIVFDTTVGALKTYHATQGWGTVQTSTAPHQLPVYANDAARSSAIPTPAQGMMIFMQSGTSPAATNNAQVYDGSAWVNL